MNGTIAERSTVSGTVTVVAKSAPKSSSGALGMFSRVVRILIGAAMLAVVMAVPATPLGWITTVALVAVYPILSGILGYELALLK